MKDFLKKLTQLLKNTGLITLLAILGAVGGQGPKWARRFLYPGIVMIYAIYSLHNFWCLTIYSLSGVLSMGYGIPDQSDEGSFLGRFFYKLFNCNKLLANIFTRAVMGILISISLISIPILTWNWITYFLGSLIIILIWALVSWRGFGQTPLTVFGKTYNLLNVDLVIYGVTSISLICIINGYLG